MIIDTKVRPSWFICIHVMYQITIPVTFGCIHRYKQNSQIQLTKHLALVAPRFNSILLFRLYNSNITLWNVHFLKMI